MDFYNIIGMLGASLLLFDVSSASKGLSGKAFNFPYETDFSYVRLEPLKPLELQAFTLCMQVATELEGEREILLFAYRTADIDELNVWREKDGRLSFYLSGDGAFFSLPPLSSFCTSICLTWDSASGLAAFWMEGRRSVRQVYKPGHTVRPGGAILLGQDPDTFLGEFEAAQSFVGEITNVNMWSYVLPDSQIEELSSCVPVPKGDVLDWNTIVYEINGNVLVIPS